MGRGKRGRYKRAAKAQKGTAKFLYKKLGADRLLPTPRGGARGHGPQAVRRGKDNDPRYKNLVDRNRRLRKGLPKTKQNANLATSDYDVYDKTGRNHRGQIDTVSGKKNYPDRGLTDVQRQGDGVFPNRKSGNTSREFDSEKKIYEDFAQKFPDPETRGRITVYSERTPCSACSESTQDFLRRYPHMKMDIVHTYKEGISPLEVGRQNNFPPDPVNDRIRFSHYTDGVSP